MKPIIYYPLIMCCLLLLAVLLSNCNREKDCQDIINTIPVPINDSLRSKVPHTGYDTLIFFNQYGDTVVMLGIGIRKYNTQKILNRNKGIMSDCQDQNRYITDIEELLYKQDMALSNTALQIPFNSVLLGAGLDVSDGAIGVSVSKTSKLGFNAFYFQLNDEWYRKKVITQGKEFMSLKLSRTGSVPDLPDLQFYYNHYQGVLRIEENDTLIWDRKFNQ